MDMNDRSLRSININLGGVANGFPREDGFDITVASEIMAIFCLSNDLEDLEKRIGNITIAYTRDKKPVFAKDLKAQGPMTVLLKDAIRPNVTQTLENNPAIIHGGPFANIAHGCNSVIATKTGLKLADYVVTEAGFGADLGRRQRLCILEIGCGKSEHSLRLQPARKGKWACMSEEWDLPPFTASLVRIDPEVSTALGDQQPGEQQPGFVHLHAGALKALTLLDSVIQHRSHHAQGIRQQKKQFAIA